MRKIITILFIVLLSVNPILAFASSDDYFDFEVTLSTNTLLKAGSGLLVDIVPDKGTINPTCTFPDEVNFTSPKQLTKTISYNNCIPKEADTFELIVKRNPNWLKIIQERLKETPVENTDLLTDPKAVYAIRKTYVVDHSNKEDTEEETTLLDIENIDLDGRRITIREIKNVLSTFGYLTNKNENTYTTQLNEDLAKLIKDSCLNKEKYLRLKYQTTLQGSCSYTEFKPSKEDLKLVLDLNDFLRGLETSNQELLNSIKENPILASAVFTFIIGAGAITTISTTVDPLLPIILTEFSASSIAIQADTIKTQLLSYSHESSLFKAGYIFGEVTKLIGLSGVIAWASKNTTVLALDEYTQTIKQIEELKTQNLNDLSKLLYSALDKIATTKDEGLQTHKKIGLYNFSVLITKLTNEAKSVLNELAKRLETRQLDTTKIVDRLGSLIGESHDSFLKIINRDNLTIPLNDTELNDLLFVFVENVEEERLSSEVIRVSKNLVTGKPSYVPERGARVDLQSKIDDVKSGIRPLSNRDGITFLTDAEQIKDLIGLNLLKKLGLDTISDIERLQGEILIITEFDTANLKIELPSKNNAIINPSFVVGGITSGGGYESISVDSAISIPSTSLLSNVNATTKVIGVLKLTESEINNLLLKSLHPSSPEEINTLLLKLKSEGRL